MHKKGPIIIIEDDEDDRLVLKDAFEELGIENHLLFFEDCEVAYRYLLSTRERPFLIICDINLPRMNGLELKQKIDSTDWLKRKSIPFVFLSTSDSPSTIEKAYYNATIQGYFQKSDSMRELKEKLKLILDYWTKALRPGGI